jgi:hypothetical protein
LRTKACEFGIPHYPTGTVNAKSMTVAAAERPEIRRRRPIPDGGAESGAACIGGKGISRNLTRISDAAGETLPAACAPVGKGLGCAGGTGRARASQ